MLRTMASILPYGKDGKPGHPEREVSKACLHFLIALFSATRKICLIYAQPESGQPRTLAGSHRDGFVFSQTLYFLEKRYTRDHTQRMPFTPTYCVHLSKRIGLSWDFCFEDFIMGKFLSTGERKHENSTLSQCDKPIYSAVVLISLCVLYFCIL